MAAKIVIRAAQKAYQNPSLLLPLLTQQQQQGLCGAAFQQETGNTFDVSSSRFACSPFLDEISQHSWIPRSGLGFPPRKDAENRHGSVVLFDKLLPYTTLSPCCDGQLHKKMQRLGLKPSFPLSQEKLKLQDASHLNPEALWKFTNSSYFPPSTEMDEVVLPSQNEDVSSPLLMSTKRTFNPSTIVRKRRHGFLTRKSTVGGRRILARRFAKGRRRLSA